MASGPINTDTEKQFMFLQDCGEMGALIRSYNWAETPLGGIETWPASLRILLSTSLRSSFPMFLFWGEELICFYNDAYRPSLGNDGKHPAILGKKAEEAWPEIWDFIGPLCEQVMSSGASFAFEDTLVPIYRNGRLENVYWTFSYSPAKDEDGTVCGVLVVCNETTGKVTKLHNVVERTASPIVIFKGEELMVDEVNQATLDLWQVRREDIIGKPFTEALPEMEQQSFPLLLRQVYHSGETYYGYEVPAYFHRSNGETETVYFNFEYSPYKEANGDISGVMVVAIDVTPGVLARKQAEVALQESEERFRTSFENLAVGVAHVALDGTWILVNDRLCAIVGYTREELLSKTFQEITYPDDLEEDLQYVAKLLDRSLNSYTLKKRYIRKNGSVVWINLTCSIVRDSERQPKHFIAVIEDITKQKQAEEELKASEEQFRNFSNSITSLAWMADGEGWIFWYNQRWYDYTGTTLEEMKGWGWEKVHHPEHKDRVVDFAKDAWKKDEPWELIFPLRHHDGEYRWFLTRAVPVKDASGAIYRWIGTNTDVHEQILAEERLKASESMLRNSEASFRQLADAMPQLVWVAESNGQTSYYNSRVSEFAGAQKLDDGTWLWQNMLHPADLQRTEEAWKEALTTEQDYVVEHRIKMADGQFRWFLSRAYPFKDENGIVLKWFGTATNIDDQKRQEHILEQKVAERTKELEQLNRALALSNQELEQFAYVASHDLQEPLRKIKAFGDMLMNSYTEKLGPSGSDLIGRMQNAAHRMSSLIEDVLSFSRVSTRKEAPELVDTSLVLKETIQDLETAIFEKNAMIVQDTLQPIVGSKHQIRQLFQNLLSNALKFSKEGVPPVISINSKVVKGKDAGFKKLEPEPDETFQLIEVRDNGIGFEPEYAEKIFQIFQRLHGRSAYAGSGVGLAIVQKVVLNHHGLVEAESTIGEGALFRMLFPLPQEH